MAGANKASGVALGSGRILIVEARFHPDVSDALAEGAVAAIESAGGSYERISVPGALEIPPTVALAADSGRFDGFVALGCVIRGDTYHFELVCNESARALTALATDRRLALGNGILTVENEAQAWERAKRDGQDKGGDAARACLALIAIRQRFTGAQP